MLKHTYIQVRQYKHLLLSILIFLWQVPAHSQQAILDSLDAHPQQDARHVDLLNALAHSYWNSAPRKTDSLGRIALEISKKLDYQAGMAKSYYEIGVGQWMLGDYPTAFENMSRQLKIAEEHGLTAQETDAYAMMALITDDQGLLDQSLEYHQLVLQRRIESKDSFSIGTAYNNIAALYWRLNKLDSSLLLFQKSYEIRKAIGTRRGMRESLSNIAYILNEQGKPREAMVIIKPTLDDAISMNDLNGIVNISETIGNIYMKLGELDSAEQIYLDALPLAEEIGVNKRIIDLNEHLARLYEQKNDFKKAYQYLDIYWTMTDSLEGMESANQIERLKAQYQAEKKEKEIIQLQQQNQISRNWLSILAVSSVAGLIFALLLYIFYRYRQKKNQELIEAKDLQTRQLKDLNQIKSRFLANISHEFRTPLSLILGPAEKLLRGSKEGEEKQQLRWIYNNGQKLLKLINQLLDLSKIEAGKLSVKASQSDIVQFSRHLSSAFESMASQKDIKLFFKPKVDKLYVYFDPEKMDQILNNLIHNAIKFTNSGYVKVEIEEVKLKETQSAKITISDSGKGIHPQQLPYVFDRFYQAGEEDEHSFEGTGIGLALCKELVDLHKGKIEVESEFGSGSKFTVFLPLGKAHFNEKEIVLKTDYPSDQVIPVSEKADKITLPGVVNEHQALIVIIDDNRDMLDYISAQLHSQFRFLTSQDAEKGLKLIQAELPDLVISDVMMPGMNGFELCEKIKNDIKTDHIPVILLTARVGDEFRIEGLKNQADDYIQKPFNSQELSIRIQNLIEGRKRLRKRFAEKIVFQAEEIAENPQEEQFLKQLIDGIEENLSEPQFDVNALCKIMNMSKSQLNRKLKAVLNKSPNQFIRSFRLEKARELIKKGHGNLSEIAFDVGFSSPAYFSKCFHDEFGYPPSSILN